MPIVIDLFAGAGGLSLGAERAGFSVAAAVEIDKFAIASHALNFPNTFHIQQDIMELSGADILRLSNITPHDLTGIIGGPPCQGFSSIGAGNVDDIRNRLFVKFFELVEELQPPFFLAENVPGIMNEKYKSIREEAFSHVANYVVLQPISVNASEYGAPTTRTRYFFIGHRQCDEIEPLTTADIENRKVPANQRTNVAQALEGLPANIHFSKSCSGYKVLDTNYANINGTHRQHNYFYNRVTACIPAHVGNANYIHDYQQQHLVNGCITTNHSNKVRHRYSQLQYNQQDKISKSTRLNPNGFCPTLRAGTGPEKGSYQAVRPIHFSYNRVITPREAARLQGFPDWYMLPDTIWHSFRQIGNSVSPIVAEAILSAIFQKLTL